MYPRIALHFVAKDEFELLILLPLKYWVYRNASACWVYRSYAGDGTQGFLLAMRNYQQSCIPVLHFPMIHCFMGCKSQCIGCLEGRMKMI